MLGGYSRSLLERPTRQRADRASTSRQTCDVLAAGPPASQPPDSSSSMASWETPSHDNSYTTRVTAHRNICSGDFTQFCSHLSRRQRKTTPKQTQQPAQGNVGIRPGPAVAAGLKNHPPKQRAGQTDGRKEPNTHRRLLRENTPGCSEN
ncbi:unnamed protein product [Rangifer tarandus platyrhynchus]|uniref:Uncharacterized protein n=1 Tax=Rangifer tarandus platyrhynchus TaxID=3082113 RepID=A0AC60A281_RANTA